MSEPPVVVWFRQDLRLADNPALCHAVAAGRPVIPLYVRPPVDLARPPGGAAAWWLERSLAALEHSLKAKGSGLVFRQGRPGEILPAFAEEVGAEEVVWNRLYDGDTVGRDAELLAALRSVGCKASSFNAGLLVEPWGLRNRSGDAYKVFTPFWRAARAAVGPIDILPEPRRIAAPEHWPLSHSVARPHPRRPVWAKDFSIWSPGEGGARERLAEFFSGAFDHYASDRDRPAAEGTTRLSPHIHFGEIGPRQIWAAAQVAVNNGQGSDAQMDKLLSELGWREFNHHILFERPDIATVSQKPQFDAMPWRSDPEGLRAWKEGRTGYPIVDAGMRQLWATGWMHNRVRMITASFLIKHLLIDWREGEAWFWDTLLDADQANNAANWQWVAGCGADASPFFRIFNPVIQGERFDPHGRYVRRWVPELADLPNKWVHQPWAAPPQVRTLSGVAAYSRPIVDHAFARERALDAFKSLAQPADV